MEYWATIGIAILTYAVLSVSLNLLFGYIGELSMATAAFFGIGAYTAAILSMPPAQSIAGLTLSSGVSGYDLNPWVAGVVGVVLAAVAALIISVPAVARVRGESLILLTFSFQLVFSQLLTSMQSVTGGDQGISGLKPLAIFGHEFTQARQAIWFYVVLLIAVVALGMLLGSSPYGRLLRGMRESESAVLSVGKPVIVPKLLVFSVACGIAGTVGVLQSNYLQSVAPASFDVNVSILVVAAVVLGGAGNIWGALLGSVILGGLTPVIRNFTADAHASQWQAIIFGVALFVIIAFRPNGLIPEGSRFRRGRRPQPELSEATPTPDTAHSRIEVTSESRPVALAVDAEPILVVKGLSKRFGGLQAVNDVSFSLPERTITALIGPNGAGKTTIFNLITRAITPDAGSVTLRGADISAMDPREIAIQGMVRSFQDVRVFQKMSALDNVAVAVPQQPGEWAWPLLLRPVSSRRREREVRDRALDCLSLVGLSKVAQQPVGSLSFGDQKLVAIARLIATDGELLLLDEPTSGVDPGSVEGVIEVIQSLRDIGKTVCLVEHSLHFVDKLAEHVIFLDQGRLTAEGSLEELTSRPDLVTLYFGT